MTMHKALHPRYDVDRLARIEDSVDASIQRLDTTTRRLHRKEWRKTLQPPETINRTEITRRQNWEEKQTVWKF